jgi:hypothetical protein
MNKILMMMKRYNLIRSNQPKLNDQVTQPEILM